MKKIFPILLIIIMITSLSCSKSEKVLSPSEQLAADIEMINDFLLLNNLTAQSTASGLRYIIEEEGEGDDYPGLQDSVSIEYIGSYIYDGVIFDYTEEGQPVTFLLNDLIPGWKEGIQLFKKGAKGILLLPSALAYGPYPPQGIRSNAVMVFDIKIWDFYQ